MKTFKELITEKKITENLDESFLMTSLWIIVAIIFIFGGAAKLGFGNIFRFIKDEYNSQKAFNHFHDMIKKVNEDPELKKTLMDIVKQSRSGKNTPRWKRGEYTKVRAAFEEIFTGQEKNLINRILRDIRDEVDKDLTGR